VLALPNPETNLEGSPLVVGSVVESVIDKDPSSQISAVEATRSAEGIISYCSGKAYEQGLWFGKREFYNKFWIENTNKYPVRIQRVDQWRGESTVSVHLLKPNVKLDVNRALGFYIYNSNGVMIGWIPKGCPHLKK
jgi:hypothetical protein